MNLEVNKKYKTKCGNEILVCDISQEYEKKPKAKVTVENVAAGYESLKGKITFYSPEGQWLAYPGGIHDVEFEAV